MAITSELVGKLGGGAEVKTFPVSGTASGKFDSSELLATIEVPPGEEWLIAVTGEMSAAAPSSPPSLALGEVRSVRHRSSSEMGVSAVATGTVPLSLVRATVNGSDSFTGHVYTVKL